MLISCHVTVVNRLLPTVGKSGPSRSCWSNIVLKELKQDGGVPALQMTVISAKNKQGVTYRITHNLENVFAKFVAQGKLTIRFREPQHDLQLSGEARILTELLRTIRGERECPKPSAVVNSTAGKVAALPKMKLVISTKAEYPITTSFPHTLKILKINNLCLKRFDRRILQLKQLEQLDLSQNQIADLPDNLTALPLLASLNLSGNRIKFLPRGFLASLTAVSSLDLSSNELQGLPNEIYLLKKLSVLRLKKNSIRRLPQTFFRLPSLRVFNIASNRLTVLPPSFERLSLEDIDTDCNPFTDAGCVTPSWKPHSMSLKALAGSCVLRNMLVYSPRDLPRELHGYLEESSFCPCGRAICAEDVCTLTLALNLLHVSASVTGNNIVPVEVNLCSCKCFTRYAHKVL